jgi:CMP-N-acetylneuraminic acid synthetase
MKVLGIIPARGGSKGVPRKNIRLLNGRPLLCYTAEAALNSSLLTKVVLSTDDKEIASIGKDCGLCVPFLRPKELAQDHSPTLPLIFHALNYFEQTDDRYDAICLLQPTTPFRDSPIIDGCIRLLIDRCADTVVTVLPVPAPYNPHFVYFQKADDCLQHCMGDKTIPIRRQDTPQAFHREGSVYVTRVKTLRETKSLYGKKVVGFPIDPKRSVNIDSQKDWEKAELLMGGGSCEK